MKNASVGNGVGISEQLCSELLSKEGANKSCRADAIHPPWWFRSRVVSSDVLHGFLEALYSSTLRLAGKAAEQLVVVDDGRAGLGEALNTFWEALPEGVSYEGFESETWSKGAEFVRQTSIGKRVDARDVSSHREGDSVVTVTNVHPEVDGQHVVHSVRYTTDATEGPNLLMFTGLPPIQPRPGSSLIWDWGHAHKSGQPAGICAETANVDLNVTLYHMKILDCPEKLQAQPGPVNSIRLHSNALSPGGTGWNSPNNGKSQRSCEHEAITRPDKAGPLGAAVEVSSARSGTKQWTSFSSPCSNGLEEIQTEPPGLLRCPTSAQSSQAAPPGHQKIWKTQLQASPGQSDAGPQNHGALEGGGGHRNMSNGPPGLSSTNHTHGGPPGLLPSRTPEQNGAQRSCSQQQQISGVPGLESTSPNATTHLPHVHPQAIGVAHGFQGKENHPGDGRAPGLPTVSTQSRLSTAACVMRSGPPGLALATSVESPVLEAAGPACGLIAGGTGLPGLVHGLPLNKGPPGLQSNVNMDHEMPVSGVVSGSQSLIQTARNSGHEEFFKNGVVGSNSASNGSLHCAGPSVPNCAGRVPRLSQGEGLVPASTNGLISPALMDSNVMAPATVNSSTHQLMSPPGLTHCTQPLQPSLEQVRKPAGPPGLIISAPQMESTLNKEPQGNDVMNRGSLSSPNDEALANVQRGGHDVNADSAADGDRASPSGSVYSDDEDIIPFDPESFGLTVPQCSPEVLHTGAITLKAMVERMLLDAVQSLRFVLHGDCTGSRARKQWFDHLSSGVDDAVMQRGNGLCLVVQRMYHCIAKAVCETDTVPMFQGGVLLHLLYGLEDLYRTRQVNVFTCMQEMAPANPFHHMDEATTLAERYDQRTTTAMDFSNMPSPYVADIATMPDFNEVPEVNINKLFRNAPFLLKKEATLPKFVNKMRDYVSQKESGPLRRYQEESVKRVDQGGNWIFVAPTGAGKTKIFVECSRRLLEKNCYGTIIVICPTVPLATQQACVYVVEGFLQERYWVNVFTQENQLRPELWDQMVYTHNVMVMTPQMFLNVMYYYEEQHPTPEGNLIFHTIDMMVLDECHHTRKEHPYNKIMHAYKATDSCQTQILGFTASPVKSTQLEECKIELDTLLKNMKARCVVIGDENEEVQKYVPSAKERTVYTKPRPADQSYALAVGRFMWEACKKHLHPLAGMVAGVMVMPDNCKADMCKGIHSSFFENWAKKTVESLEQNTTLSYFARMDIICSCELIRCCNNSLDLLRDGGFESALKYLAKKTTELSQKLSGRLSFNEWIYPKILTGLYATRPIQEAKTVLQAFRMSPDASNFQRLPRFVELVKFLDGYSEHDTFHGIVFVKTRDGVYHLASMLRNHPQLRFLTPIEFIGHGRTQRKASSKAGYLDSDAANDAIKGMTGTKQREILDQFSMPGRHVLVATSAAEEGINVATCEFVVRYSVTETGIQRVQSRGRTRKSNGIFFNIIEQESKEDEIYEKSRHEEKIMNIVLKLSQDVEHL